MTAPLVAMDTETVGLHLAPDVIWEWAAIRRDPDGTTRQLHLPIDHDRAAAATLPDRFRLDHDTRYNPAESISRLRAALTISDFLAPGADGQRVHIVGAVPNFDTERLALLMADFSVAPPWHHHLICAETLAVGYLAARGVYADLPWDSDELSQAIGVQVPEGERHTAMGDARWALALYDTVTARRPVEVAP